jgi:hypothetical protein
MPDLLLVVLELAALSFVALFGVWMFIYMGAGAFYQAQRKYKQSNYVLHDLNLNFPPGLALLMKEWIEEYQTLMAAKHGKLGPAMKAVCIACHRPIRKVAGSVYVGRCSEHHNRLENEVVWVPEDRVNREPAE